MSRFVTSVCLGKRNLLETNNMTLGGGKVKIGLKRI